MSPSSAVRTSFLVAALAGAASASTAQAPATTPATPAAAPDKPSTRVDASKGGLTVRHGDNVLTFGAYVQMRAVFDDRELYDADAKGTLGYGEEDGVLPSFDVTRVRLAMRGTMFRPWVRYMVSLEGSRTSGESDSKIKDAYLELGSDRAAVRAGQYKVPFGMQTLTSDVSQGFVERSIAATTFAPDRDTGMIATGLGKGRKLGWSLGAFNGSGEGRRQNNESLLWSARAWYDPLGEYRLAEGAVDGPPKSIVHLGLALRGGDLTRGGRPGVVQDADSETAVGLELGWRRKRAWANGEGYWQRSEVENPTSGPDVEARGLIVQGGFLVLPRPSSSPCASRRWTPAATPTTIARASCAPASTTTSRATT